MLRHTLALVLAAVVVCMAGSAYAQQATDASVKPAPRPPAPEGLPTNIKVELTITDQAGPGPAAKRTVSMLVADRSSGSVRTQGQAAREARTATLNVDASPVILKDGQMRMQLGLEYLPRPGSESPITGEGHGSLNQRISLIVESGKSVIVSQASDPTSDRKISVELTATILK